MGKRENSGREKGEQWEGQRRREGEREGKRGREKGGRKEWIERERGVREGREMEGEREWGARGEGRARSFASSQEYLMVRNLARNKISHRLLMKYL